MSLHVQPVSADMRFRNLESGMQGKDFDNLSYLFCFAVLKTDLQNFRFRIPESRFLIPESHVCGNGLYLSVWFIHPIPSVGPPRAALSGGGHEQSPVGPNENGRKAHPPKTKGLAQTPHSVHPYKELRPPGFLMRKRS